MNRKQRRHSAKLGQIASSPLVKNAIAIVPGGSNPLVMGRGHHQAGRLAEAAACYRRVLAAEPDHAEALHLLGIVANQTGQHDLAVELITRAIKQDGQVSTYFSSLGMALSNRGKFDEAVAAYRHVIRLKPNSADAYSNVGAALSALGKLDEAVTAFREAIRINPDLAEAHYNVGNALRGLGKLDEAVAAYRHAVRIKPNIADAYSNLGAALGAQGKFDEAIIACREAIRIKPDLADAHCNLGNALCSQGKLDEALASCDQALTFRPDHASALNNRGTALHGLKRYDEALRSYDRALSLRPNYDNALNNRGATLHALKRYGDALESIDRALALRPDYMTFYNRGNALREFCRFDEALASYDQAIALKSDYADAFTNRALCKLLIGRYIEGWSDYEWRWDATDWPGKRSHYFPNWRGEDLQGRHLLVFSEQGLGDIIQFARYLPLLPRNSCRITFLTGSKMIRLLRPLTSGIEVVSTVGSEQKFDFQCPLMSLPHRFGTDLASIPNSVPYLRAEDDLIARWRERIGVHGFKIGIAWQGNPQLSIDRGRSIPLKEYLALARLPGVRLISLQKHHGLDQLGKLPDGVTIEALGRDFDTGPDAFVDTAAVIENLDLIITSDTSIPHLAGAFGRPTWIASAVRP